ncbi:actin nucleation-promoting factor WASL-like [Saccopteryx leptura]|uniref:actin nucleation-promoting factor WASL-like n=1 Tax=Saccopteryx leptura TaxID=249018 RepID=UPI00339CBC2E
MSTTKHFGLNYKEELYLFKEREKVRWETTKDFLRFKQKLASKPSVDEVLVCGLPAPGPAHFRKKGGVSCARPQKSSGHPPPEGPATPAAGPLPPALRRAVRPPGRSEGAAPGELRPFRPQDFYLRSSAFLRHRPLKEPPVIATRAGTSRPVVLVPPPAPRRKPGARRDPRSPRPPGADRDLQPARGSDALRERAPPVEPRTTAESSFASEQGHADAEAALRHRRVRIRTHSVREGRLSVLRQAARSLSQTDGETVLPSDVPEAAPQAPGPARVIPTSIEEIIASLQSEAQLASDQTIKELIQSVLGQNYDIKMEDISLMGRMYWHKPSQGQTEQGLQISIEEPQMNEVEESSEAISSTFQTEQEDILEWGTLESESMLFKPRESSEIQPADESSKPLADEQSTADSKAAKWVSLKNSTRLLHSHGP